MVVINTTLSNFNFADEIQLMFGTYDNDYEYTVNGVFRKIDPPPCSICNSKMSHNGYNQYQKNGLGAIKIGKYICPSCGNSCEESRGSWINQINNFLKSLAEICLLMRKCNVSYRCVALVLQHIYPINKDTIYKLVKDFIENADVPPVKVKLIVNYDEQYLKINGKRAYRLTVLDYETGQPIAEERHRRIDADTILDFISRHLPSEQPIFIVTDGSPTCIKVFESYFGDNLTHQHCLTHLSCHIVDEFPRKSTFEQEHIKYRMLNIFYNRDTELKYLDRMVKKEMEIKQKDADEYENWLKKERSNFRKYVHDMELKRRCEKKNLELRTLPQSQRNFNALMREKEHFTINVQKRLDLIEENWERYTAFHSVDGAPATNNAIENYYSITLKKHHKKEFRTDGGVERHLKLHRMRMAGMLEWCGGTLFDQLRMFLPFLVPG